MRTMVLWCPDWSVTAALLEQADTAGSATTDAPVGAEAPAGAEVPAAVLSGNRVLVSNAAARAEGVRRGQRRRDAQARCPEVLLLPASPERDARWFEPVLATVEELRPGVAPIRPGLLAVPAPGRFFARAGVSGEEAAAALLAEHLVGAGVWDCRFGVADDLYAAERAARSAPPQGCEVVAPGESAAYLRDLPVTVLADEGPEGTELADLLRRLGLLRLGDLAALGAGEVANRFGSHGVEVWRRVQGAGVAPLASRTPPPELACEISFEPPLDSAEAAAFSVRTTAERFVAGLAARQLVATGVRIEAEFESSGAGAGPGVSARSWLHPRCFTSRDLVDRVHWQLQAGLASSGLRSRKSFGTPITAPVTVLRLLPEVVEPAGDHAEGLWGGGAEDQVVRGVARVQAMVGYDAVRVPVLQGGRGAADRQALVPWGERPTGLRPVDRPWPGAIPGPAPTRVFAEPHEVEVVDDAGAPIAVTERGMVTGEPVRIRLGRQWCPVAAWAGPWPVDEGWWLGPGAGGRVARFQLVGVDGRAWLLRWEEGGCWWAEAAYD
ncbi:DNA polymerase Y family protein [Nocardioides sp. zg-ZUI104]|uniref:DNA polymerase Y family protein n=1 Tax=Nocardioides faecalis TaxID=2803858 RepID=UPI001BCCF40D|nr:DNA polymerase Y family protein [Nocardioides faecalis]MBS4753744.1 DNA polymerase Y family protein [Nocardioides faecalis]